MSVKTNENLKEEYRLEQEDYLKVRTRQSRYEVNTMYDNLSIIELIALYLSKQPIPDHIKYVATYYDDLKDIKYLPVIARPDIKSLFEDVIANDREFNRIIYEFESDEAILIKLIDIDTSNFFHSSKFGFGYDTTLTTIKSALKDQEEYLFKVGNYGTLYRFNGDQCFISQFDTKEEMLDLIYRHWENISSIMTRSDLFDIIYVKEQDRYYRIQGIERPDPICE